MFPPLFWVAVLRIWVGLYWIWNGVDDRRKREDIATMLARCGSTSRFVWYRNLASGLLEAYASIFASLLPFTTLAAGLLIMSGVLVEMAVIYLILYCLNLYAVGLVSMKSLSVQLAPLFITGLSGSGQTLSLLWLHSLLS